jgi:putative FmdB family regulatory protein
LPAADAAFVARPARVRHDAGAVPTYDYQCRSCGNVTEVIHAMTADGPTVCERCGGDLRRVLYPAGIIFKGSGFYRTDSRAAKASTDGGGSASTTQSAGAGSSSSSSSGSGETTKPSGSGGTSRSSGSGPGGGTATSGGSGSGSSGGESAA